MWKEHLIFNTPRYFLLAFVHFPAAVFEFYRTNIGFYFYLVSYPFNKKCWDSILENTDTNFFSPAEFYLSKRILHIYTYSLSHFNLRTSYSCLFSCSLILRLFSFKYMLFSLVICKIISIYPFFKRSTMHSLILHYY